jgi:hypothetical protein
VTIEEFTSLFEFIWEIESRESSIPQGGQVEKSPLEAGAATIPALQHLFKQIYSKISHEKTKAFLKKHGTLRRPDNRERPGSDLHDSDENQYFLTQDTIGHLLGIQQGSQQNSNIQYRLPQIINSLSHNGASELTPRDLHSILSPLPQHPDSDIQNVKNIIFNAINSIGFS